MAVVVVTNAKGQERAFTYDDLNMLHVRGHEGYLRAVVIQEKSSLREHVYVCQSTPRALKLMEEICAGFLSYQDVVYVGF